MGDLNSTFYTDQLAGAYTRNTNPSAQDVQKRLMVASFTVESDGNVAQNDSLLLGKLGIGDVELLPTLCTVRCDSGVSDLDLTLQRVNAAGTAAAISGAATATTTGAAFAGIAAPLVVGAEELIQLNVDDLTAFADGKKIYVTLVYATKRR